MHTRHPQMRFAQVCRAARDMVVGSSRHDAYMEVNKHCGPLDLRREGYVEYSTLGSAEKLFASPSNPRRNQGYGTNCYDPASASYTVPAYSPNEVCIICVLQRLCSGFAIGLMKDCPKILASIFGHGFSPACGLCWVFCRSCSLQGKRGEFLQGLLRTSAQHARHGRDEMILMCAVSHSGRLARLLQRPPLPAAALADHHAASVATICPSTVQVILRGHVFRDAGPPRPLPSRKEGGAHFGWWRAISRWGDASGMAPLFASLPRSNVRALSLRTLGADSVVSEDVLSARRSGKVKELYVSGCRPLAPLLSQVIPTVGHPPAGKSLSVLHVKLDCSDRSDILKSDEILRTLSDPSATHELRLLKVDAMGYYYAAPAEVTLMHLLKIRSLEYLCVFGYPDCLVPLVAVPVLEESLRRRVQSGPCGSCACASHPQTKMVTSRWTRSVRWCPTCHPPRESQWTSCWLFLIITSRLPRPNHYCGL